MGHRNNTLEAAANMGKACRIQFQSEVDMGHRMDTLKSKLITEKAHQVQLQSEMKALEDRLKEFERLSQSPSHAMSQGTDDEG